MAEPNDFIKNHLAHAGNIFNDLKAEIESGRAVGLISSIVPNAEIAVLESLLNRDTLRRVKGKHTVQEVKRIRVGVGEEAGEGNLWHERELSDVVLRTRRANSAKGLFVGSSEKVEDLVKLIHVIPALEERPAPQKFRENTSDGPDVDYQRAIGKLELS